MERLNLQNKDCVKLLKSLPDNSVDLAVVDPPYFIGYDGGKGWDSGWSSEREYLDWCNEWTQELERVVKPNRMIVVFGTLKTNTFLKYKLETEESKGMFPQTEIIWSYNWGGRTKKNFARKHEFAWCFSTGKDFLFNDMDVRVERKVALPLTDTSKGTIPTAVWTKNNHTTSKEYCKWHPTQKPLMILERLIKAYSNEGDTVLDCFSGSGSTAVAAINTGRNFIGSELDAEYFELSKERIKKLTSAN